MTAIRIPGTDDDLRRALDDVNLPTLLLVLTQLSGDARWMGERYRPAPIVAPEGSLFPDDSGGYDEEIAAEIRAGAFDLLRQVRDEGGELPPAPTLAGMRRMMAFSTAEPVEDEFCAMLLEETHFVDRDEDWFAALQQAVARRDEDDFRVLVVGAGPAGICAGIKLAKAGVSYRIVEKNDSVGGTWYENSYPDCGVDTPNHFYSYSFDRNPNWSGYFSKRDELYAYFDACVDKFGIRDAIELESEVRAMRYDADTRLWSVDVRRADGGVETLEANVVISAVGQLNRPNIPEFEGLESFEGTSFHSARWRHDVDLEGRRVAVVGTGCSAVQLLPKTAAKAAHTFVFQRSPHWVLPNENYYRPVEAGLVWALNHIPFYAEFHRARMIFGFMDRNWPAVPLDPAWEHTDRAMNEISDGMRAALTEYIREQLGERQDLLEKCVPQFPVLAKRPIIDNEWYPTVARDDVDLVTEEIVAVRPNGIETSDGMVHEVDAIIFATGFRSNLFLWPMEVVGRSGTTLGERWGDYPRAYKGMLVPDYPNLFCLYGPNTNIVHGGSILYTIECQVHYVMQCLALMLGRDAQALEIPEQINDAYNDEVQEISKDLAWGHPNVHSWYKNSDGRVVNNSPFSNLEYWSRTHDVEPNRYRMS